MDYQKEVESLQIGLILLGYDLPQHGVDGLFGPETAAAVSKFKSDNGVINENSNSLRSTLTSLGYDEKGNELSSGGEITDELSNIVSNILKELNKTSPETKVTVTSGNDQYHQGLGYNSKHTEGKAVDLTLNPYTPHVSDIFTKILDSYKGKDSKFSYINEYDHPSGAATGGHFHLQYAEGVNQNRVQSNNNQVVEATPETINKMIDKLKLRGVTKDDLDKLIDRVVTGGGDVFTDIDITTENGVKEYAAICDKFLAIRTPNPLGITGNMLANGAKMAFQRYHKYVPPELALAQLTAEGGIGNGNLNSTPIATKNPFDISNTETSSRSYGRVEDGIDAYYNLIARDYLGGGKTAQDLIQRFVNKGDQRYATTQTYENVVGSIAKQVNRISKSMENT
jgi:peptidoglycan hydrolase-like protein with peptidoglycan-binding domain